MSARAATLGWIVGLTLGALTLTAHAEPLTLADALARAHASHPDLRAAAHQVDAAEQDRAALRSRLLPSLDAEASVLVWDEEQTLSLGGGGGGGPANLPPPTTPYEEIVAQVAQALGGDTTVRDQVTGSVAVTLTQPLTPIVGILAASEVADRDIEALRAQRVAAARRIELQVVEAYFRVRQAEAVAQTAEAGVRALEARAATAAAYEQAGLFGRNDVLKVQVAVLAARQSELAARHDLARARAALALAMGVEGPIDAPLATEAPAWAGPPDDDAAAALGRRAEVRAARARVEQAQRGVKVRRTAYIPDVSLLANYTRTEGSSLQQPDAFYAGAALRWNLFQWGGTARRVDQAEALARAAAEGEARLEQSVAFEVAQARLALDTAHQALEVAQAAVEQATEAARLERARFDTQQATSTDVLDAEVALTQAQRRLDTARFDRVIALARLRWASGLPLQENRG